MDENFLQIDEISQTENTKWIQSRINTGEAQLKDIINHFKPKIKIELWNQREKTTYYSQENNDLLVNFSWETM